jgi:HlyD family secretion protein
LPVVLVLLLAAGYYAYSTGAIGLGTVLAATSANTVSGFIEGEEVSIAAEVGGRIEMLSVNEGDHVSSGQEVVRLDHALLDAQVAQAQTALESAKAQLALVEAAARPEDIRQAESVVAQAAVVRDGAKRAWDNAQTVRDNPQELDTRIAAAQAQVDVLKQQVEVAKHTVEAAVANAQAAEVRKDSFGGQASGMLEARVAVDQWWAAEEGLLTARAALDSAQAGLEGAQKSLAVLQEMRAHPLTANAQVDAAKAQYDSALTAVDIAQARLDGIKAGATKEQIAVAEAMVKQAEAALTVIQVQLTRMSVISPVNGVVTRRAYHAGEIAGPGTGLVTIATVDPVKLKIYVPETEIGNVKIGDTIGVRVDSFPGKTFNGKVTYIATQGEFTPRNVQTKSERVNIVFAVKVEIPNPNQELKAGMPADAFLK